MNKIFQLYRDYFALKKQPVNLVQNESEATIYIYDVISADWGVSAMMVIDSIAQIGEDKTLNIRINSPGGDVFEARAIIEAIKRYPGNTIAHIDSLAASCATSIACAAQQILMSEGAFYMIHNASGLVYGDKNDMRKTADLLEKIESAIVDDYVRKTGVVASEIIDWMNAETWFTAKQALEHGFIDAINQSPAIKNNWNLSAYGRPPDLEKEKSDPPPSKETTNTEPADAGFFMSVANTNRLRLLALKNL